jgi:hypothetical protein
MVAARADAARSSMAVRLARAGSRKRRGRSGHRNPGRQPARRQVPKRAPIAIDEDDGVKLARERGMDALFVLRDGDRCRNS